MVKIVEKDIAGARASNAGDRFHELWALRKALSLLDPDSKYKAISVEGVPYEDSSPSSGTWSAVDVCLLTGGTSLGEADTAEFVQLKYSSANPGSSWTVPRLASNSAKRGNNSVLRKLAQAAEAAESIRATKNAQLSYSLRLVSNQPVGIDVLMALGQCEVSHASAASAAAKDRETLRKAAGLSKEQFTLFASMLDFSECGAESLFEQEAKAIRTLDRLIEGDTRPWHLELLRLISDAMLPSVSREPITEEVLLSRLGIGTEYALFPCPNRATSISSMIERAVTRNVAATLQRGTQRLGIHGGAGCGKTTTIGQLATILPPGSVCIQYDCYGGGSYLDDSAPRHRPTEAFTQLSNEIALKLRVPRLLRTTERGNSAKAFKERLEIGAEVLRDSASDALLVIAVDAADNAVTAAARRGEHCFVKELASIADLPQNVRIVISSRTARLSQLDLPPTFSHQQIEPFSFDETQANVCRLVSAPDQDWVREFHRLTRGIPRVQAYSLELSANPHDAIQFLLPNGRGLSEIFEQAVLTAWKKGGEPRPISLLCAALISLDRPVPLSELAHAIGSDLTRATDLCEDLSPTLLIKDGGVSFSDEDFENFVEERGKGDLEQVRATIAESLLANASRAPYAARHVVQSLIAAGREQDALRVAMTEPEASLFPDPVERRLCHLERMRSALRVCRQTGSAVESLTILLVGAEALRTSDAIARELALNPDLSARYARDSLDRLVLSDERYVEANGPILCHYMAEDAKGHAFAQVARSRRLFFAWQSGQIRHSGPRSHSQHMTVDDIAALCRAELATLGIEATLHIFRRLRRDRYAVFAAFVTRLLGQGDVHTLESLLSEPRFPSEARIYLAGMLAKAGIKINLANAVALLDRFQRRGAFAAVAQQHRERFVRLRDCALDLCEIIVHSGQETDVANSVLNTIAQTQRPRWQHIDSSDHMQVDALLRAECLLAELSGKSLDAGGLLDIEGTGAEDRRSDSGMPYRDQQKRSDIAGFVSAYLPFYQARARYVKSRQPDDLVGNGKSIWMDRVRYASYSASQRGGHGMRYRVAESMSSLVALGDLHLPDLFAVVKALIASGPVTFGSRDASVLRPFTWRTEAHPWLTELAEERESRVSDLKTTSSEKASSLLELSRLLCDCSPQTSASLFNAAVLVLGDIDVNEMRLLGSFDKLSRVASSALDAVTSKKVAIGLASFGTAVAFRLRDYDHFPWRKLSRGITYLNAPVALAAAARWDDEGLATRSEALAVVLRAGVNAGSIPVTHAAACSYLVSGTSDRLMSEIAHAAVELDGGARPSVYEILAEHEALTQTPNPRTDLDDLIVSKVPVGERRRWVTYLAERCQLTRSLHAPSSTTADQSTQGDQNHAEKVRVFLAGLDWRGTAFDSAAQIRDFIKMAYARARDEHSLYFIDRELHQLIRASIPAHRRCEHLSQLAELALTEDARYDLIEAITDGVTAWYGASIAVRGWCSENLPKLLSADLVPFMRAMHDRSPLSRLIEVHCVPPETLYRALLEGLAENIQEFDATRIYDLLEVLVQLVSAKDVASVLARYVDRLAVRVHDDDRLDPSDVPTCIDEAFARLLYAYLSDVDLAVRWSSAHAVRSLFSLEASGVLDKLILRYGVLSERSFRAAGAPFYWLAARLWLTIAIARACDDKPAYAAQFSAYLFSVLDDEEFPHLLVKAFAKHGIVALRNSGALRLTIERQRKLTLVDGSPLRKKRRLRELDHLDDEQMQRGRERRFQFDSLDTLRYWYPGMARIFAGVSLRDFVDEAERWIVERWGVTSNPWRWDEETRRDKFKHSPHAMSHSHGGLPRVERFHTHLEWHAMWCAAGEMLKSQPLARSEYGDDSLAAELNSATTVSSSLWASDLRSPKPLENRFWVLPNHRENWVTEPSSHVVLELLGLSDGREWCVVSGNYDCYWLDLHETVHVQSCLVSPKTAPALLRALQSSASVHAHYLPHAGDDGDGIDMPSFKLKGWLSRADGKSGLDAKDDIAEGISPQMMQPGDVVRKILTLGPSDTFLFGWERQSTSELVFFSEQWADEIPDRRLREETDFVRSKGERLHCKRHAIEEVLLQEQCDLLIKVQTYRKQYEEHRYSESDKGESAYFNRYILLTSQGYIKDAAEHVGTWKVTCPGDPGPG